MKMVNSGETHNIGNRTHSVNASRLYHNSDRDHGPRVYSYWFMRLAHGVCLLFVYVCAMVFNGGMFSISLTVNDICAYPEQKLKSAEKIAKQTKYSFGIHCTAT